MIRWKIVNAILIHAWYMELSMMGMTVTSINEKLSLAF